MIISKINMNFSIHPTANLIKQLNFRGRRITFKENDIQDKLHTCSGYHNEKWVENYDRTNLPYFIHYTFNVYKNEYDFKTNKKNTTFIIKFSPCRKYRFPNNEKMKLDNFNENIKIFQYNKIQDTNNTLTHNDVFEMFCNEY